MTRTLIGYSNLAKTATLSATSAEAALPVTNLAEDRGSASLGWQTLAGVTSATITCTFEYAGSDVRLIGLFNTNFMPNASLTITGTLSGGTVWSDVITASPSGYRQAISFVLPTTAMDSVTIAIDDPTNPDGFLNAAQLFIGDAFAPALSISGQSSYGSRSDVKRQKTRGGQTYNTLQSRARVFTFDLGAVTDAEAMLSVAEIDRLAALGGNILFIPDHESTYRDREALFGELTESKDVSFSLGARNYRSWGGMITERL